LLSDLAEARKKKKKRQGSPKTPPGSPLHPPPPPLPPAGPSRTSGASGTSGSSSKTAASAEYTAWTMTGTRLKPSVLPIPEELHMDDDTTADEQAYTSSGEDVGRDHVPTVNLRQSWWKPLLEDRPATPEPAWSILLSYLTVPTNNWASALKFTYTPPPENSLLAQIGDMATFMDLYCKKQGISKLTQKDLEGPAYEIVKVFHPDVVHLQFQMEECHKLLTDQVDDAIRRCGLKKNASMTSLRCMVYLAGGFKDNGSTLNRPSTECDRRATKTWLSRPRVEEILTGELKLPDQQLNLTNLDVDAKDLSTSKTSKIIDFSKDRPHIGYIWGSDDHKEFKETTNSVMDKRRRLPTAEENRMRGSFSYSGCPYATFNVTSEAKAYSRDPDRMTLRDDDEEEEESSGDDADDEEEDEDEDEDEEKHLAPADSVPPPVYRTTARMSIRTQTPMPFPSEAEIPSPLLLVSSPLPISPPPLPASPTHPLGYRTAMIWLRAKSPSTSHPLPLPSPIVLLYTRASVAMMKDAAQSTNILASRSETPPSRTPTLLPIPLPTPSPPLLLPSTDYRVDVLEVTLPPQKRLCIAHGPIFEVEECLSTPTGGFRADYGFVATLDAEIRHDLEWEIGYQITDIWDTDEIYERLDDAQDDRLLMSGQLNLLRKDSRPYTTGITHRGIDFADVSVDTGDSTTESAEIC
ncbi:hypothetical protein Tco_0905441, partial [Tanacetum coccineum]